MKFHRGHITQYGAITLTDWFCVDVPDNRIGASGATALVEGLKEMRNLETLILECEFCTVVISGCDGIVM